MAACCPRTALATELSAFPLEAFRQRHLWFCKMFQLCVTEGLQSAGKGLTTPPHGWLAQLVERFVYTENVGGSSPSPPTISP